MALRPHDMVDLHLVPVALAIDQRLSELATLTPDQLFLQVSLATDREPVGVEDRRQGLLATAPHVIDLKGWVPSWDATRRGLRLGHAEHSLTLGISDNLRDFLAD